MRDLHLPWMFILHLYETQRNGQETGAWELLEMVCGFRVGSIECSRSTRCLSIRCHPKENARPKIATRKEVVSQIEQLQRVDCRHPLKIRRDQRLLQGDFFELLQGTTVPRHCLDSQKPSE